MTGTIIALASDHAGYPLKEMLKDYVRELGYQPLDLGTDSSDSVDYPDYGHALADAVTSNKATFGIAVCGIRPIIELRKWESYVDAIIMESFHLS